MNFFKSISKSKDGPGLIRVKFCGYVKNSSGGVSQGVASIVLNETANNKDDSIKILATKLSNNSITDASKQPIATTTGYTIKDYAYNESKSKPGNYYHDFNLSNANDRFCYDTDGGSRKSRRNHNSKKSKINKKSKRNKKSKKHRKTRKN